MREEEGRLMAYYSGILCLSYRVVQLLQSGDGEKVVNIDPVLQQKLDKIHPVEHQSVHHGLLQRIHLRGSVHTMYHTFS